MVPHPWRVKQSGYCHPLEMGWDRKVCVSSTLLSAKGEPNVGSVRKANMPTVLFS